MHMASYLLILSELYLFFTAGKWENMVFNLYTLWENLCVTYK